MKKFDTLIDLILTIITMIMFIFFIIKSILEHVEHKEGFVTKKIKEMYRPFVRNVRINYNNIYNKLQSTIYNFFKKLKIL
mgnify:CR=1 FL=1